MAARDLFSLLLLSLAVAFGLNSAIEGVGIVVDQVMRWLAAAFTITLIVDAPFVVIIFLIEATSGRAWDGAWNIRRRSITPPRKKR